MNIITEKCEVTGTVTKDYYNNVNISLIGNSTMDNV